MLVDCLPCLHEPVPEMGVLIENKVAPAKGEFVFMVTVS